MITNHKPGLEVIIILLWHSAKHSKAVKLALMADDERLAIEMLTSQLKLCLFSENKNLFQVFL